MVSSALSHVADSGDHFALLTYGSLQTRGRNNPRPAHFRGVEHFSGSRDWRPSQFLSAAAPPDPFGAGTQASAIPDRRSERSTRA